MGSRVRVPYAPPTIGTLTEWLGSGLQNRVQQFESAGYLKANVISNVRFFCARMNWLVLWLIGKVTVFILMLQGALVQLVRIHACHAWGHGFESRTDHGREVFNGEDLFFLICTKLLAFNSLHSLFEQHTRW